MDSEVRRTIVTEAENFLQVWVNRLLERPLDVVIERYCKPEAREEDGDIYHYPPAAAEKEVELLKAAYGTSDEAYRTGEVGARSLLELHERLRCTVCEDPIWDVIVRELAHPLPDEIANDLIDRGVAIEMLGHSRQSEPVQWRLASFYPEALLTLGIELYTDPNRDVSEFRALMDTLLEAHPGRDWLLGTLLRRDPFSPEKERVLTEALDRYPDSPGVRRMREVRPLLLRARNPSITAEEAEALLATREPEVLEQLANNPATSGDLLRAMTATRGIRKASYIRALALSNLRIRGDAGDCRQLP